MAARPGLADRIQLLVSSTSPLRHELNADGSADCQGVENDQWWLHVALLLLTLVSTTVFGYGLVRSFQQGVALNDHLVFSGYSLLVRGDTRLAVGCIYAIPLLLILLAHELGHYITCRRWGIPASLPYFGPSPTLFGTLGAFIRVRSPIYRKRSLFDVGISGPIAGFALALPALIVGVSMSKACPGGQTHGSFVFATPLLLRIFEALRFPGVRSSNLCLHPVAMAAWAGLLATAINLLPVSQTDGGHIVYALWGKRVHAAFSWAVIVGFVVCGYLYWPWWIWAAAMFFFRRHPLIFDPEPIGKKRKLIAISALLIFILSFSFIPVLEG